MVILRKNINIKVGQPVLIVPIGDVHYNTKDCDKERFHNLIHWLSDKDNKGYKIIIIGMGDYTDPLSSSERASLLSAKEGVGLHASTLEQLDDLAETLAQQFKSAILPVSNSIIGLLEGHHYMVFSKHSHYRNLTTTEYLSKQINAMYLGQDALIKLQFPHGQEFRIFATHGRGNAPTPGGRLNKRLNMNKVISDAHLYLMGHDHSKLAYPQDSFVRGPRKLPQSLKQYYCGTGAFLRAYRLDSPDSTYAEEALMPPSNLGVIMCHLELEKLNSHYRIDYHVSV